MAACASAKTPRSRSRILPPPRSSAGVPTTLTVRPMSSATRAAAMPAPTAMAAIRLCPQAWPMPGEAVVLGAQGQVERPRAGARHERRREASDTALDGEAGGVEGFGAPGGGALLLEGQLGMGVDAVAQRDQAVPARGDPLADGGSGIHGDLPAPVAGRRRPASRVGARPIRFRPPTMVFRRSAG